MIDLSTSYMGLKLKNPIVIGACNIVSDLNDMLKLEEAGAAAIVYKSLFEEQLQLEAHQMEEEMSAYEGWDAEHDNMFPDANHAGPREHLLRLKKAKQSLGIPLIASINCVNTDKWAEFAVAVAETGVDALELNFYANIIDPEITGEDIVKEQLDILQAVRAQIKIPIAVKLSPYYTNTLSVVTRMDKAGADGFVLFNKLFQPDIDLNNEEHHYPYNFSNPNDGRLSLRYAGLLYNQIEASIISSSGVFSGSDIAKMTLAGADAVQVVSAIYKKGMSHIEHMLQELTSWMITKEYETLNDFRGKLSKAKMNDPFAYKRAQYVDILMKSEIFMKYHPKDDEQLY